MRDSAPPGGTVVVDLSSCAYFTQRSWVAGDEAAVVEVSESMGGASAMITAPHSPASVLVPEANLDGLVEMLRSLQEHFEDRRG